MSEFFIICQPGFEAALKDELVEFWPYLIAPNARPHHEPLQFLEDEIGGVSILAADHLGQQINFFSKIASRVLQRVAEFRARDFPKLHEKLKSIPVQNWLGNRSFFVEAQASKSRLNNEKRILKVAQDIWGARIDARASDGLMIRMFDDMATVSIDTSGRHLHFRLPETQNKNIGEAPLRETIAAFMIRNLIRDFTLAQLGQVTIWDPMAGSGTLLSEAAHIFQANFQREFNFQNLSSSAKILKSGRLADNYPVFPRPFLQYWASDSDAKMIPLLADNLADLQNSKIFFHDILRSELSAPSRTWILANPPYGERIDWKNGYAELLSKLARTGAERISLLIPIQDAAATLSAALTLSLSLESQHFIRNGGIKVTQLIFKKTVKPD